MTTPIWHIGHGLPDIPPDVDCIFLMIERHEVLSLHVGRAVDDLMTLSDSARLRRQLAHGVLFSFSGWDEDPREITEIPECRAYLQALNAQWGYSLHFLAPIPDLWAVLLSSMVEGKPEPQPAGQRGKRVDPEQMQRLVDGITRSLTVLHRHMGLAQDDHQAVLQKSLTAIGECWI